MYDPPVAQYDIDPKETLPSLFSVESEFQTDLDNRNLSDELRGKFEAHYIRLSQNLTVSADEKRSRWLIRDNPQTYVVRKDGNKLNIHTVPAT